MSRTKRVLALVVTALMALSMLTVITFAATPVFFNDYVDPNGVIKNTAYMVNGRFPVNVIVHYFDKNQIEREAVIPTAFEKGASTYPIGMTMDIYEYQGKYGWDPDSVRDEILSGEQELMDDKPVDPSKLRMTAVQCPNCGASYQAAAGYTGRCPYCGSYHNVE